MSEGTKSGSTKRPPPPKSRKVKPPGSPRRSKPGTEASSPDAVGELSTVTSPQPEESAAAEEPPPPPTPTNQNTPNRRPSQSKTPSTSKKVPSPRSSGSPRSAKKTAEVISTVSQESINSSTQRRLEVKVRTRKLLARRASNRDNVIQIARRLSELDEVIKTVDDSADFDLVREELETMMNDEVWDSNGIIRAMFVRLVWNSCATYDVNAHHASMGGINNGGYGGATMRFSPEKDDEENRGLVEMAEKWLGPIKEKHPKISYADLWVLASYVAIASIGGPVIEFRGGRFDAKDATKSPRDENGGSRLPKEDYGDDKQTVAEMKKFAQRLCLDDEEFSALLLGVLGLNRGRSTEEEGWLFEEEQNEFAPCLPLLAQGLWIDITSESNARYLPQLKPQKGSRHFASIGSGFEAQTEEWAQVPITPTEHFDIDMDYSKFPMMEPDTVFTFTSKKLRFQTSKDGEQVTVISYQMKDTHWVHDYLKERPYSKAITMCAGGEASLMLLPRDMVLKNDPDLQPWLHKYSADFDLLLSNFGAAFKKVTELGLRKQSMEACDEEEGGSSRLVGTLSFTKGQGQTLTPNLTSTIGGPFVARFRYDYGEDNLNMFEVIPESGTLIANESTSFEVTYVEDAKNVKNMRLLVETEQEDFQFIITVDA